MIVKVRKNGVELVVKTIVRPLKGKGMLAQHELDKIRDYMADRSVDMLRDAPFIHASSRAIKIN